MEIGFGFGEHLAQIAANNPNIGFIGCEPFENGIASLLAKVKEQGLTNLRVYDDDARLLIHHLPDACLEKLFILFSDPWPKLRHHKRRISAPENLTEFARLLGDNGQLIFATDMHSFAAWSLANLLKQGAFEWTARRPEDWKTEPKGWVQTRYQLKALEKGLQTIFIEAVRIPRDICVNSTSPTGKA